MFTTEEKRELRMAQTERLYNLDGEFCGTISLSRPLPNAVVFCGRVFVKDVIGYKQVTSYVATVIDAVNTVAWEKTKKGPQNV